MILAHDQLAHTAAANLSSAIRYVVYIRMHRADRPKDSLDVLTDLWKYWYGTSEVVQQNETQPKTFTRPGDPDREVKIQANEERSRDKEF